MLKVNNRFTPFVLEIIRTNDSIIWISNNSKAIRRTNRIPKHDIWNMPEFYTMFVPIEKTPGETVGLSNLRYASTASFWNMNKKQIIYAIHNETTYIFLYNIFLV